MATKVITQLMFVLVFTLFATNQAWGWDCDIDKKLVKTNCISSIQQGGNNKPPNSACCHFVKYTNVVCICHILTPDDEITISVAKLVHVAKVCGNPLPVGTKCGSKY